MTCVQQESSTWMAALLSLPHGCHQEGKQTPHLWGGNNVINFAAPFFPIRCLGPVAPRPRMHTETANSSAAPESRKTERQPCDRRRCGDRRSAARRTRCWPSNGRCRWGEEAGGCQQSGKHCLLACLLACKLACFQLAAGAADTAAPALACIVTHALRQLDGG